MTEYFVGTGAIKICWVSKSESERRGSELRSESNRIHYQGGSGQAPHIAIGEEEHTARVC